MTCSGMHQEGRLGMMMGRACAHVAGLKHHKHVGQSYSRSTGLTIGGTDPVDLSTRPYSMCSLYASLCSLRWAWRSPHMTQHLLNGVEVDMH
jgi:hypothetical protein